MSNKLLVFLFALVILAVQAGVGYWYWSRLNVNFDVKRDVEAETVDEMMNLQNRVAEVVDDLSVEQKVGQLIMAVPEGLVLTEEEGLLLREASVSGYFLLGKNVEDAEQVASMSAAIYAEATPSGLMPFVAVDQEGGLVSRIKWIDTTGPEEVFSKVDAFAVAKEKGLALKKLGFNMNFAPVAELSRNDESFISDQKRAFDSIDLVVSSAVGYSAAGITPVVKHFPGGLGRVTEDPHNEMPTLEVTAVELSEDMEPFRRSIDAGVEFVMVSHIIYPQYDSEPVSASSYFIDTVLRSVLNFDGIVVVDDLSMGAISEEYDVAEYGVQSVKSGADLLLISGWDDYLDVYGALVKGYGKDEVLTDQIDESVRKIVGYKLVNAK